MLMRINIQRDGFDDFYELFNTDKRLFKQDIKGLFNKPAYEQLVNIVGPNVGMTKKTNWIEVFLASYHKHLDYSQIESKDIIKRNMMDSIYWALNNKNSLHAYVERLTKLVNRQQYISSTLKYLPEINLKRDIDIHYYIFMNNACVEENKIFLDVSFASQLTDS